MAVLPGRGVRSSACHELFPKPVEAWACRVLDLLIASDVSSQYGSSVTVACGQIFKMLYMFPRQAPWDTSVRAAMAAAGLHTGDIALHVGRHFSLRDAMKWAQRMLVTPFLFWHWRISTPPLTLGSATKLPTLAGKFRSMHTHC